jgi:hypothetical protein
MMKKTLILLLIIGFASLVSNDVSAVLAVEPVETQDTVAIRPPV